MGSNDVLIDGRTTVNVVLESPNPSDLAGEDLLRLVTELQALVETAGRDEVCVTGVVPDALGVANHWLDVVYVFLPSADFVKDAIYSALLSRVIAFMRTRFARKHESARPRVVVLYDHTGQPLKALELKTVDADPVERDLSIFRPRPVPADLTHARHPAASDRPRPEG